MRAKNRYVLGGNETMPPPGTPDSEGAQHRPVHLRVTWLCGLLLFLEGYDIAAVGYAIPSLADAWRVEARAFTATLVAGNFGLLLGSLCVGWLGDRLGRKPVIICCAATFGLFSLLSALANSPEKLAGLRFLTGLGLGGGIPVAIALAADFAPPKARGRLVMLMSVGVPIGIAAGGLLAGLFVRLIGWPAIFVAGGVAPLAMVPFLALWLPESGPLNVASRRRNPAAALFLNGLAPITLLLWAINLFSLLGVNFILLWTPALLHNAGVSPSQAIFTTMVYALSVIASPFLMAPIVDRFGMERGLACALAFGACCLLLIGVFDPPLWLLMPIIWGTGIGGGCQAGINALSGLAYPSAIRSTGAGWALGAGRIGAIVGPLLGGVLLALGFRAHGIFATAAIPAFGATLLMTILARLRLGERASSDEGPA
jgi:MFS transporter, AAHS family, 4-hydroxybenzoate transporter